jgi:hypothetical protein
MSLINQLFIKNVIYEVFYQKNKCFLINFHKYILKYMKLSSK